MVIFSRFDFLLKLIVIGTFESVTMAPCAGLIDAISGFWLSITISALRASSINIFLEFLAFTSNIYSPGLISLGKVNSTAFFNSAEKSGIIVIWLPFSKSWAAVTIASSKKFIVIIGLSEFV